MRRLSEEDVLRAKADPSFGRRLLDCLELGVWPARLGRRRISATFAVGAASCRPPDLPPPEFSTVGEERTMSTWSAAPVPSTGRGERQWARRQYRGDLSGRPEDHFEGGEYVVR